MDINRQLESQMKSSAEGVGNVTVVSPVFTLHIPYWNSTTLFGKVLSWLYWCDFTVELLNVITFYKGLDKRSSNEFLHTALVAH